MNEPAPVQAEELVGISYVLGPDIEEVWPLVYELVASACDETITPREIYDEIQAEKALLWVVSRVQNSELEILAVATTRVHDKNGNRWLDVTTIAGKNWAVWSPQMQHVFEQYAKQTECEAITAHVRRGLTKWLKQLGWKERQVHMEFKVDG